MNSRIAIVGGGGGVGASLAFNLLLREEPYEIALVDGRSGMARSHEMDLQQVLAAGATGSVRIVGLAARADADVVVVSASVPLTVNPRGWSTCATTRRSSPRSAARCRATGPASRSWSRTPSTPPAPGSSAPRGLDRRRRARLHRQRQPAPADGGRRAARRARGLVDAWVIGEHGDGCVLLLDRVRVDGEPVTLDA